MLKVRTVVSNTVVQIHMKIGLKPTSNLKLTEKNVLANRYEGENAPMMVVASQMCEEEQGSCGRARAKVSSSCSDSLVRNNHPG